MEDAKDTSDSASFKISRVKDVKKKADFQGSFKWRQPSTELNDVAVEIEYLYSV